MVETLELDIIAIIIASLLGIVLHALGILPEAYVTSLILLLLALHALHGMTQATKDSKVHKKLLKAAEKLEEPEVSVIATEEIFENAQELALKNRGEMWWFNTPLGLRSKRIFDKILKPAMDNTKTSRIIFIINRDFKSVWEEEVEPMIKEHKNSGKVSPPIYREMDERIAFRMIDVDPRKGVKEAHLTFLEKPFTMKAEREGGSAYYPRFAFHVKSHSRLIQALKDIFMEHQLKEGG